MGPVPGATGRGLLASPRFQRAKAGERGEGRTSTAQPSGQGTHQKEAWETWDPERQSSSEPGRGAHMVMRTGSPGEEAQTVLLTFGLDKGKCALWKLCPQLGKQGQGQLFPKQGRLSPNTCRALLRGFPGRHVRGNASACVTLCWRAHEAFTFAVIGRFGGSCFSLGGRVTCSHTVSM